MTPAQQSFKEYLERKKDSLKGESTHSIAEKTWRHAILQSALGLIRHLEPEYHHEAIEEIRRWTTPTDAPDDEWEYYYE